MLPCSLIKIIYVYILNPTTSIVYSFKMATKIDGQRWKAMVSLYRGDVNDQRDIEPFHTHASKGSTLK